MQKDRTVGWTGIFLALLLWGTGPRAEQFLFLERTVYLDGDNRLYADWEFLTSITPEPQVPVNWVSPVNYYQGRYYMEFQVVSMTPTANYNNFCVGWQPVNPGEEIKHNHTWESYGNFRTTGLYKQDKALTDMWYGVDHGTVYGYNDWDWTGAWKSMYCYINPHGQNPFPVKIRVKFYIISNGATYTPNPLQVARPVLDPAGGTFAGPTYVWITCTTPGAEIRRAYGELEPSRYSVLVEGPVKIPTDRVLNIKAFKDGYESSPLVTGTYILTMTDQTPPDLTAVNAQNDTTVYVVFSEYVATNAQTAGNYTISPGAAVTRAVLVEKDMKTVELTTSALAGGTYTLTVNNVTDLSYNVIAANTQKSFTYGSGLTDRRQGPPADRRPATASPFTNQTVWKAPSGDGEAQLFSTAGALLCRAAEGTEIDTRHQPPGIYFLRLLSGKTTAIIKLIKLE